MKRKVLLFLSILASCMSLTACDYVPKNDGDENIQKEKVEEREDSHKKEAEEDKDNEEKEDKKSGIQKELDDVVVTIHSKDLDLNQIMGEWIEADHRGEDDWLSKKTYDIALEYAKAGIGMYGSYNKTGHFFSSVFDSYWQEKEEERGSLRETFEKNSKYDFVGHESLYMDFSKVNYFYLVTFSTTELGGGAIRESSLWDSKWPNGTDSEDGMASIEESDVYWQNENSLCRSDFYYHEADHVTGFGKSYLAIYLDGKWVDISAYEGMYAEKMQQDYDKICEESDWQSKRHNSSILRTVTLPEMWILGDNSVGLRTEETAELMYKSALAGVAINDCIDKIENDEASEMWVIRAENQAHPQMSEEDRENVKDYYSCVLIKKAVNPVEEERKALRSLYKEFFYKNYGNEDLVCLKDITHDGTDDMIVIHAIGEQDYTGEVYTVDHGKIKKIYEKYGGTCHAGGFFNWYLIQNGDEWCLAEEVFGMWQGLGELEYVQYYLTNDGELKEVDCLVVPASDDEVDEEGYVKDDALVRYKNRLGELINRSDCLFWSYTEASVNPKMIDANPEIVFKE